MTKTYRIAVLPGDGIGHEVTDAAEQVMLAAAGRHGVELAPERHACGAFHYRDTGLAISPETLAAVDAADATLFGAAGWPDIRDGNGVEIAPQIDMRERFALFAGLRPIRLWPGVAGPLARGSVDMLVIREQTEGLFAGRHDPAGNDPDSAQDRMVITRAGCERLFELAFAQARQRRAAGKPGHVTLFDKANVLRGMALMRRVFDEVAERHPDIGTDRAYIDNASMQMVTDPGRFDVIVMENQFGDIVSEIAAGISGGWGLRLRRISGRDMGCSSRAMGRRRTLPGGGLRTRWRRCFRRRCCWIIWRSGMATPRVRRRRRGYGGLSARCCKRGLGLAIWGGRRGRRRSRRRSRRL